MSVGDVTFAIKLSVPVLPRSRGQLLFVFCLLLAGYFTYTAVVGAVRNHTLAEQRAASEAEVLRLQDQKAYLEGVLAYVSSDDYVEQQARRQLGYARPGEIPFVVVGPELEQERVVAGTWWERLFPR